MAHYWNLAFIPQDNNLAHTCTELARVNFSDKSCGYLLGNDALAHVTLCQFLLDSELNFDVWEKLTAALPCQLRLNFTHIYVKPGAKTHLGKFWVGLAVEPNQKLFEIQRSAHDVLGDCGIQGITEPSSYFPHLTLARLRSELPLQFSMLPREELWNRDFAFALSIGRSDENGVYREKIFPNTD